MACRIVICDDQPGFRRMLSLVLGLQDGIEVVAEAEDGLGVVDVVAEFEPDVLLLDIAMPERDGLEALPHVRAASPETSVVMLTAFGSASMRRRAHEAGADGLIEKGVDLDEMVAQIREACRS